MTTPDIETLPYRPNAGIVLVNRDGLVFAGQRLDNPGTAWQMPQGGVDKGEDVRAAALRELTEETGVAPEFVTIEAETDGWITYDLPPELLHRVWKGRYRGQKQKWFLMRFTGTDERINIEQDHPEFSCWKWMTPETLINSIVPFKREVYETVFRQFGGLL
jgi:putative (di)nucleoside polyphosphate hydrolase